MAIAIPRGEKRRKSVEPARIFSQVFHSFTSMRHALLKRVRIAAWVILDMRTEFEVLD